MEERGDGELKLVGDNGGTAARFDGEHTGLSDGEPRGECIRFRVARRSYSP